MARGADARGALTFFYRVNLLSTTPSFQRPESSGLRPSRARVGVCEVCRWGALFGRPGGRNRPH